jgi:hypothetical protein
MKKRSTFLFHHGVNLMTVNNDRAKCSNRACPLKKVCDRWMCEPGDRQWWSTFYWYTNSNNNPACEGYIPFIMPKDDLQSTQGV